VGARRSAKMTATTAAADKMISERAELTER
jgi:hypothetical protein